MLNRLIGLPEGPVWVFASMSLAALPLFFGAATLSYRLFFVRGREVFHPDDRPDRGELRQAMKWSVIAIFGNAALVAPIHWLLAHGYEALPRRGGAPHRLAAALGRRHAVSVREADLLDPRRITPRDQPAGRGVFDIGWNRDGSP